MNGTKTDIQNYICNKFIKLYLFFMTKQVAELYQGGQCRMNLLPDVPGVINNKIKKIIFDNND